MGEHQQRTRPETADTARTAEEPGAGDEDTSEPRKAREQEPSTIDGLPRRVRQASLAPQLKTPGQALRSTRSGTERDPAAAEESTTRADERDPDEVRSRMASLQRGWQRGRQHNDGTTPKGNGR